MTDDTEPLFSLGPTMRGDLSDDCSTVSNVRQVTHCEMAMDQAQAYLDGRTKGPYSEEAMRWMIRGLMLQIDDDRQLIEAFALVGAAPYPP